MLRCSEVPLFRFQRALAEQPPPCWSGVGGLERPPEHRTNEEEESEMSTKLDELRKKHGVEVAAISMEGYLEALMVMFRAEIEDAAARKHLARAMAACGVGGLADGHTWN